MPRTSRIDAPGALHHIIIRGIERKRIFQDDTDRQQFENRLGPILTETSTGCYAWAFLPNHVHLLLRTGVVPLATVMRRLLTGYAVTYNRRHRRNGPLFQNRYKSILCQEDAYLVELVRYIHLNPLRAHIVAGLGNLDAYPYTGHSVILGHRENNWQDVHTVLAHFGRTGAAARRRYREYVQAGIEKGQRPDLIRGSLMRSLGGWSQVTEVREGGDRRKGEERILGDSRFVREVLAANEERLDRRYRLQAQGYGLEQVAQRVATLFEMEPREIYGPGRHRSLVHARSLFCYWAVRELGASATALARTLGISQPAVSIAVRRGEKIAKMKEVKLLKT
ncbi:MAG: transposase [Candidatus Methylomirabilales bacterium]